MRNMTLINLDYSKNQILNAYDDAVLAFKNIQTLERLKFYSEDAWGEYSDACTKLRVLAPDFILPSKIAAGM